jgi:uncharacterized membrane protein YfcA
VIIKWIVGPLLLIAAAQFWVRAARTRVPNSERLWMALVGITAFIAGVGQITGSLPLLTVACLLVPVLIVYRVVDRRHRGLPIPGNGRET